jgi:hypothetical protein
MKTMKVALLATAALAAVSVSARADDTAAIKAQLEALNARIAQLEASPAAPVGYSLLTISEGQATKVPGLDVSHGTLPGYGDDTATIIGVMPTADAPASTTIEWSGYVRAIVAHIDYGYDGGDGDTHIGTRAQLKVVGKTDTAVGEVGARIQLRADGHGVDPDPHFYGNEYWGWWAMTPEVTFGGGFSGSLGNISYGVDGSCTCYGTDWFTAEHRDEDNINVGTNPGDVTQIRLSWGSGPMTAAIALEDSDYDGGSGNMGVAGEIKYAGDSFSGEISGVFYEHDNSAGALIDPGQSEEGWQVGAGVGFALGEMVSLSAAGAIGEEPSKGDYWSASALVGFTLTDSVRMEAGASYVEYDDINVEVWEALAGIYYEPVSQLTLGLEVDYAEGLADFYGFDDEALIFDFVFCLNVGKSIRWDYRERFLQLFSFSGHFGSRGLLCDRRGRSGEPRHCRGGKCRARSQHSHVTINCRSRQSSRSELCNPDHI